ncbi:MAG TPA: hypothetical protein DCL75_00115 [Ktedonobacter sp.]|jgi:hypothetical protein|nr:hypothetical protein [Ktedonobacter sp.]HCF86787.1 hypothetical protein [Ktedonobacter sp.]
MNVLAIGHAELYMYPENTMPQESPPMPQRIDVTDLQVLVEVLNAVPSETSFSVLLVINECVVGNGKYFMNSENTVILHEYGACVGFLIKPLALLREARQRASEM